MYNHHPGNHNAPYRRVYLLIHTVCAQPKREKCVESHGHHRHTTSSRVLNEPLSRWCRARAHILCTPHKEVSIYIIYSIYVMWKRCTASMDLRQIEATARREPGKQVAGYYVEVEVPLRVLCKSVRCGVRCALASADDHKTSLPATDTHLGDDQCGGIRLSAPLWCVTVWMCVWWVRVYDARYRWECVD